MAKQQAKPEEAVEPRPEYTEQDKSRARQWFKKAQDLRERQNHDYAIESYVTGLGFWPEAIDEGVKPLWSLAIQRQQAGGKKPGMMEAMKKPTSGKDQKQAMLNSLLLLAKDPTSSSYADALLKNAAQGGFIEMTKWAAERALESLKRDKKPSTSRFKAFREHLAQAGEQADAWQDPASAVQCYELAVRSVDFLVGRNPTDMPLKELQRDLSGKLTIARGKYGGAEDFRESLHDAEGQRLLHDAERMKQGDQTLENLLEGLRKQYEQDPDAPRNMNAYVEALLKTEREQHEATAIAVLESAAERMQNYNFKLRADDVRLRQLSRRSAQLKLRAQESGSDDDKQQYRLARVEELETLIEVFRERVAKYPTDLRMKAKLGEALFRTKRYDEAIPILQAAQNDPRSRVRCQLMIGRAFMETGNPQQAGEVLAEAITTHDRDDDLACELLYNQGLALEASGRMDEARAALGRVVRIDYNYANGDARKRLSAMQQPKAT